MENDSNNLADQDEDMRLLKRALYVEMPKDFNPDKIPENGEEYLQHVIHEARNCPSFVVAPIYAMDDTPTMSVNVNQQCIKAPISMIPSMPWQNKTIVSFTKLRTVVFRNLDDSRKSLRVGHLQQLLKSEAPKLSTMGRLLEEDKVTALERILEQMNDIQPGHSIDRRTGLWIYSLLCTLETPLCPDTCHILRELARKCSQIRANLNESYALADEYIPLNLFICIIARYFRQLDLADECELEVNFE